MARVPNVSMPDQRSERSGDAMPAVPDDTVNAGR
jgi:hypothetical protein